MSTKLPPGLKIYQVISDKFVRPHPDNKSVDPSTI